MALILAALVLSMLSPGDATMARQGDQVDDPACRFDPSSLDAGYREFDLDKPGNWRAIEKVKGCEPAAAEMLSQYRERYEQLVPLMAWHEGQVRASIGQYPDAIELMRKSRRLAERDPAGWNLYVDATIAFLRKDRRKFQVARRRLLALRKPPAWPAGASWPQNANVLRGLWKCFDRSYQTAYGDDCRR